MPSWREVIEDENYKLLPMGEKIKTKNEFFKYKISPSNKFKSLAPPEQNRVKTEFFTPRREEGLLSWEPTPSKPTIGQVIRRIPQEFERYSPFPYLDKPVEEVAKFIEPDVAQRGLVGAAKFFPRQIAADFTRAYKPSTVGAFLLATQAIKPIAKPVGKFVWKKAPEGLKKVLLRELTIGKGQPPAYQEMAKEAQLSRLKGGREAEEVAKKLSIAPEDIRGVTKEGIEFVVKKGQPIPLEYQRYIGRIFRKEIDLGGRKSFATLSPKESARIGKNVEVEVAFNPKVQSLQNDLTLANKALRDREILAKGLVGKEFRTETGFIEKAIGVSKVPKFTPSGKTKKGFDIGLVSEPVSPKPPTVSPIPSEIAQQGEEIVRGIKQVSQAPTVNKFQNLSRIQLLKQRSNVAKQLQKEILDIEVGVRTKYFSFDRTFTEQLRTHPKYQQLASIADEGRAVMDKWSTELAQSGIPKEQARTVIEGNVGQYMARTYQTKLKPQEGGFSLFKNLRLRLNGLKHRKELSTEVRNLMGEIKEPALPTAIRVKEISTSIANNKLFNRVAQNPEWASTNAVQGWTKIPDTPAVGALRGKWVIPEIAEDINAVTTANQQAQGIYLKALSAWKYMKVPLNPAAQFRNMLSNTILLDLSGTSHLRQARLFPKAFGELLSKGKVYQQALEDGAIGGEFVGGEIQRLRNFYVGVSGNNLQRWLNVAKMPFKKAGDLYQGMEQVSKLVKYMDVLEKGGTRKLAAGEAQKWLFNYTEVPKFIDFIRKSPFGAPFITFTYKSLPRLVETLVNRPLALYKYYALFNAWNETSRKYLGMSPVEYARQKRALPSYLLKDIGGIPANLLLPYRDKYGRTQWLNLEYILPLGQSPEIMQRGLLKGGISNPLFNILSDLNKNSDFRGQPIIPLQSTPLEATKATISHIYRQLVPNLAPAIPPISKGGYSFEKIMDAILQRPDFAERTRDLTPVLLDTLLGIKINPLDVNEAEQFKMWDKKRRYEELQKQTLKLYHPAISDKEREKQIEVLFKKMQSVIDEK